MKFKCYMVVLICFSCLVTFLKCDLPVHCLKSDIEGTWLFRSTSLREVETGHDMKCGHSEPSTEHTSISALSPFPYVLEYNITLSSDYSCLIEKHSHLGNVIEKCNWTMIYDEGFHIISSNLTFFAFSKYEQKQEDDHGVRFISICYKTLSGWVKDSKNRWGCYEGFKLNVNKSRKFEHFKPTKAPVVIVEEENSEDTSKIKAEEKTVNNKQAKSLVDTLRSFFSFEEFNKVMNTNNIRKHKDKENLNLKELSQLQLTRDFTDHEKYIKLLNLANLGWEADIQGDFQSLTLKQLNKFAGINAKHIYLKELNKVGQLKHSKLLFLAKSEKKKQAHKSLDINLVKQIHSAINRKTTSEEIDKYPKQLSYKHLFQHAVESQKSCGSCYTWSTMRMLEARLKLRNNIDEKLSVQHALNCSFYNQGCQGGYSYLVMKYGSEFDLVPEGCLTYKGENGKCENFCSTSKRYRVRDFKYVGGGYGLTNELNMIKELNENGPFVASFEPEYAFMFYKNGIYRAMDNKLLNLLSKPEWTKVDHSVLLIGYGVDSQTGEKYWELQNSWGDKWGDQGYFKIRRGRNDLGIESIGEAGIPYLAN